MPEAPGLVAQAGAHRRQRAVDAAELALDPGLQRWPSPRPGQVASSAREDGASISRRPAPPRCAPRCGRAPIRGSGDSAASACRGIRRSRANRTPPRRLPAPGRAPCPAGWPEDGSGVPDILEFELVVELLLGQHDAHLAHVGAGERSDELSCAVIHAASSSLLRFHSGSVSAARALASPPRSARPAATSRPWPGPSRPAPEPRRTTSSRVARRRIASMASPACSSTTSPSRHSMSPSHQAGASAPARSSAPLRRLHLCQSEYVARSLLTPRVHHAVVAEGDIDALRAISSGISAAPRRFG